jgi:hypothetical protein
MFIPDAARTVVQKFAKAPPAQHYSRGRPPSAQYRTSGYPGVGLAGSTLVNRGSRFGYRCRRRHQSTSRAIRSCQGLPLYTQAPVVRPDIYRELGLIGSD